MDNNPNDYKVVTLNNKTDFDFTPEIGAMYDGRPIFGISGEPCIKAGESVVLPYHVGNLLATNLAKAAMVRKAPATDPAGIPTGVPLWDETSFQVLKASYLTEMYSEGKPAAMSETDKLMAKVAELQTFVEKNIGPVEGAKKEDIIEIPTDTTTYSDKADVIAELTKRDIKFDARKSKAELEKLIV